MMNRFFVYLTEVRKRNNKCQSKKESNIIYMNLNLIICIKTSLRIKKELFWKKRGEPCSLAPVAVAHLIMPFSFCFFFTEVLWNFQVSANSKFPHLRISFPEQFFKKLTTFSPSFLQHLLQNFWSVFDYVLIKKCLAVLELF